MFKYVLRRLIQSIPTLLGITLLSFILMTAAPGGPTAALGVDPKLTVQERAIIEAALGANDPWFVQYVRWLVGDDWMLVDSNFDGELDSYGLRKGILRGDFGNSFQSRRPVISLLGERVAATFELGIAALTFGIVLGIPVGVIAAVRRGGIFDNITRVLAVLFNAIPNFWLGLILILIFGSWLRVLPMGGRCPTALFGCPPIYERMEHMLLPTFTLGTVFVALFSRFMRTSMLEIISQDYIRTAKAKGLNTQQVWFKHGMRNAMIPIATFLGPAITGILGGAVITETIFSWPGLGRFTLNAVLTQDYPVIMAGVILAAVTTVMGFLLSDFLYAAIDPRIRFS